MAIGTPISTVNVDKLGSTGCNYDEDITALEPTESPNSIDIEFDDNVVRKRPGYVAITTTTGTSDVGYSITNFGASSGTQRLVSHQGNTVFSLDNLSGAQTIRRAGAPRANSFFSQVASNLIHTFNDNSAEYYWDGATSLMAVLSGSAPGMKHTIESQGFLLGGGTAANPLRVYYEDTSTMIGGSFADFFTLSGGRDDELTGFFILHGITYATTKTSVFRISFVGGVVVFSFEKIVDTTGAVPRTAQTVVTDSELGEVVLFLGFDRNLYLFTGRVVQVISDKFRKPNNDAVIALDLLDRSRIENAHATFDVLRRIYRLFVTKLGDDDNEFCINIDARNLAYYPYQNMKFHSSAIAQDAVGRLFLIGNDYSGILHKMFTDVNSDNGTVIVETYEAPPLTAAFEHYKKIQTIDLSFTPVGNYSVTYDDKTDFDIRWKSRTTLPMFINRDRFLGENAVLGNTAKLGSESSVAIQFVNIPVTNNAYRFRLGTGGTAGAICSYVTGTVAGAGMGTTLTGTSTVWTSDMTVANGWRIWINDGEHKNFVYTFEYISATSATVSAMTGTSPTNDFTGAAYELFKINDASCAKRWELLKIDYVARALSTGKGSKLR